MVPQWCLRVTEISVISGNMIRKANPSFEGAHLVITSHSENMESIAYTIKVACVCPVDAQQTTMNTWRRTFGKAEVLFFANTSIAKGTCILIIQYNYIILSPHSKHHYIPYPLRGGCSCCFFHPGSRRFSQGDARLSTQ